MSKQDRDNDFKKTDTEQQSSSCDCPSFEYQYVESEDKLNKAFDIIFTEVLERRKFKTS